MKDEKVKRDGNLRLFRKEVETLKKWLSQELLSRFFLSAKPSKKKKLDFTS